jgi:hypothetical protein
VLSSSSSEAAVAIAFDTAFRAIWTNATLAPYIPTNTQITETSVSTASATFKQTTKTRTTGTTSGTSTDVALPYHTCEIVTWRTAQATKYGRGRWYLPPLASNALSAVGFGILGAAQTALVDGLNAYFASVGSTYTHVILHRKATAGGARAAYSTDPVIAADIPSVFTVQRRRADKIVPSRMSITI